MNNPFVIGRSYSRNALLDFVQSKQGQTGIIWGKQDTGVVICTSGGRHGAKAGYADGPNGDGTWTYFGQGEKGDQNPEKFANKLLVEGKRSILLFSTVEPTAAVAKSTKSWKKSYTFAGEFCSGGWDFFVPETGRRKGDKLLKFTLVPASYPILPSSPSPASPTESSSFSLAVMKDKLARIGAAPAKGTFKLEQYFQRSDLLREYAKKRACGRCELCGKEAPFLTLAGIPFLEVHHILRLADDGPDVPENVAALCPNCHREAHHGAKSNAIRSTLSGLIEKKELHLAVENDTVPKTLDP